MAFPPSPIVHAEYTRRRSRFGFAGDLARRPQQRVRADRHGQLLDKPCAGLAAHCEPDAPMQNANSLSTPGIYPGNIA